MGFENILFEKNGNVATIVLNRPENRNALDALVLDDFSEAVRDVAADPSVRALILTGAGPTFSAGGDLKKMALGRTPSQVHDSVSRSNAKGPLALLDLKKPVIAAVNGHAYGAGMNMVLACDFVLAAEEARFCQAFVRVGLVPDFLGFYLLPRLVGLQKAKELMFTGKAIDSHEAERLGIVTRVLPGDQLMRETLALAEQLASGPTQAIGLMKRALLRCLAVDLPGAVELEASTQAIASSTFDYGEGVRAFLEKRSARFEGR